MKDLSVNNNNNNEINLKELTVPQTAFSAGRSGMCEKKIFYITDIHLLHHLGRDGAIYYSYKQKGIVNNKYWEIVKSKIKLIVNNLFDKDLSQYFAHNYSFPTVLFGGDTSSDTETTKFFYHYFQMRYMYHDYKQWRRRNNIENNFKETQTREQYETQLANLQDSYKINKDQLFKYGLDYDKISKRQFVFSDSQLSKFIIKNHLPQFVFYRIKKLIKLQANIRQLEVNREKTVKETSIEKKFIKPERFPIFVILGNHELSSFNTVQEAVNYYEKFFSKERIIFLHNSGGIYGRLVYNQFGIIGGIGFAKFNKRYNALNIVTTNPPITIEDESKESDEFFEVYQKAVMDCKNKCKHLLVLSHYPLEDWCNIGYDSVCTYFNGHTHRNNSIHQQTIDVYADNQIGYKTKSIKFKACTLGLRYNPFVDYKDGYFEITTTQYINFLGYRGEKIQGTGLIDNKLVGGNAKFYMIKRDNFYGFFLINKNTGTSICFGGVPRKVNTIKDINYFYNNFTTVVSNYISLLLPLRKMQEQLSQELKQLGMSGAIHGLIVDVDFYHHIFINPVDGKVAFYYSPYMGTVQQFNTFKELLSHIESATLNDTGVSKLQRYNKMANENCLISQLSNNSQNQIGELVKIDIKDSEYTISKWVNQAQRLFSSNILRVWDDELIKSFLPEDSSHSKKHSLQETVKAESKINLELDKCFDKLIKITNKDKNFITWETTASISQEMLFAVCRKFVKTFIARIKRYKQINFGYTVFNRLINPYSVSVKCLPSEISEIYQKVAPNKKRYGSNVVFEIEFSKNDVCIDIAFSGQKEMLPIQGDYIYENKQLIKEKEFFLKENV